MNKNVNIECKVYSNFIQNKCFEISVEILDSYAEDWTLDQVSPSLNLTVQRLQAIELQRKKQKNCPYEKNDNKSAATQPSTQESCTYCPIWGCNRVTCK